MDKVLTFSSISAAQEAMPFVASVITRSVEVSRTGRTVVILNLTDVEAAAISVESLTTLATASATAITADHDEIRAGLAKLREYIALASPTNAQSVAVLRILCRGMALVVKRLMEIEE